jgi:hypothetical protein
MVIGATAQEPMSLHGYLRAPSPKTGAEEPSPQKLTLPMLLGWTLVAGLAGAMFVGVLTMKRGR